MRGPLPDPEAAPSSDSGQGAGLQIQRGRGQTDGADTGPGLHLQCNVSSLVKNSTIGIRTMERYKENTER